jgi:hypothetical protein
VPPEAACNSFNPLFARISHAGRTHDCEIEQGAKGWAKAYNTKTPRAHNMSAASDDLTGVKDDMVAFIEGHGMRRFHGYVEYEEVQSVMWESGDNPDGWKDFVELAKAAAAPFLTMHAWVLKKDDLDELIRRISNGEYTNDEDLEDARWLRTYIGKTGFVQLGWAHQGSMFLFEANTEWYDRYQRLLELSEDFGGITIDEPDQEDEP